MAAELRWILLGLSVPLLLGIWWWTARRSGQAPGNAELRESSAGKPAESLPPLDLDPEMRPHPEPRDWGVPPFEPLNIRTAEFDHVPVLDGPMMVHVEPAPRASVSAAAVAAQAATGAALPAADRSAAPPVPAPAPPVRVPAPPVPAPAPAQAATHAPALGAAHVPNAAELQRIVTVRVCAVGETRWSGGQLLTALELHGLAFGRYQVFHRKHADGRSLFCVASLIEPGTFDAAAMPDQEFRGVTLFAVLPGPTPPIETIDELLATARGLAEELSGMLQDAKGMPLSPQRAALLREDVARFQASLPRVQ